MFLLPLAISPALAGHWTLEGGAAAAGGAFEGGSYAAFSPFIAANYGGRLWIAEGWLGGSASGLRSSDGKSEGMAAPLQAELGLGLGGKVVGAGFFVSQGFAGSGGGLYARLSLPGAGWMDRWGAEARIFNYGDANASGFALLFRVEPPKGGRKAREDKQRDDAVHHEDPYASEASAR